jgi:uncharacterized OB-fold protein
MEIPRHWRLKAQRYRLEGSICPNCGELIFPPRPVCSKSRCNTQMIGVPSKGIQVEPSLVGITASESYINYRDTIWDALRYKEMYNKLIEKVER